MKWDDTNTRTHIDVCVCTIRHRFRKFNITFGYDIISCVCIVCKFIGEIQIDLSAVDFFDFISTWSFLNSGGKRKQKKVLEFLFFFLLLLSSSVIAYQNGWRNERNELIIQSHIFILQNKTANSNVYKYHWIMNIFHLISIVLFFCGR